LRVCLLRINHEQHRDHKGDPASAVHLVSPLKAHLDLIKIGGLVNHNKRLSLG